MKYIVLPVTVILLLAGTPSLAYQSLQDLFNQAQPQGDYDKYIVLDPGTEYEGDLRIPAGHDVCVVGNGARIYAENDNRIHVGLYESRLDMHDCVLIGGLGGIYFGVNATGTISNNTITGCADAGIKLFSVGSYNTISIYDNIITDCHYGFFCNETEHPSYLGYNTVYNMTGYRYAEFCPS